MVLKFHVVTTMHQSNTICSWDNQRSLHWVATLKARALWLCTSNAVWLCGGHPINHQTVISAGNPLHRLTAVHEPACLRDSATLPAVRSSRGCIHSGESEAMVAPHRQQHSSVSLCNYQLQLRVDLLVNPPYWLATYKIRDPILWSLSPEY